MGDMFDNKIRTSWRIEIYSNNIYSKNDIENIIKMQVDESINFMEKMGVNSHSETSTTPRNDHFISAIEIPLLFLCSEIIKYPWSEKLSPEGFIEIYERFSYNMNEISGCFGKPGPDSIAHKKQYIYIVKNDNINVEIFLDRPCSLEEENVDCLDCKHLAEKLIQYCRI